MNRPERNGTKATFPLFGTLLKEWNEILLHLFGSYIIKEHKEAIILLDFIKIAIPPSPSQFWEEENLGL